MNISNENKTFHTSIKIMHVLLKEKKHIEKKTCVQQVCMYVYSMTHACMHVTVWCTKSCDLLSWKVKENNTLECLVSYKVLETVQLGESISECTVSIWKTDWYLSKFCDYSSHWRSIFAFAKEIKKTQQKILGKGFWGHGKYRNNTPHHACPQGEMLMAVMHPCFFSALVFSEQTVKLHNKLIKNNLESRAWLWPWKTLMIISCCDLGKT